MLNLKQTNRRIFSQEEIDNMPQVKKQINHREKIIWLQDKGQWYEWEKYIVQQKNKKLIDEWIEPIDSVGNSLSAERGRYYKNIYNATHYHYEYWFINGYYIGIKHVTKEDKILFTFGNSIGIKFDEMWWL